MTLFSKLRELEKKATQGEWFYVQSLTEEEASKPGGTNADLVIEERDEECRLTSSILDPISDGDAEFIAELQRAMP